jgi:small subunit ribosomal protein S5
MAGAVQKSRNNEQQQQPESDVKEMLVSIRRVAKVVKGGRRFGFSALVIAGDGKGKVGYGSGSGIEVQDAKKKATEAAKRNMIRVQLREGRTFHHDVIGVFGAGKVSLRAAKPGTGIIAGGPLRAVFECLGVNDVVAKSIGTPNAHNMVKACFNAFEKLTSPRHIAEKRGKKVGEIVGRRESNSKGTEDDKKE